MAKKYKKGQSLFEVLISLAISALIIVSLVGLVTNSVRNTTFSKNQTVASRFAQETTEWLRNERDKDIATFITNAQTPVWCLDTLSWSQSGSCGPNDYIMETQFVREVHFSTTSLSGKDIIIADIKVIWQDGQGLHEITSSTNFSDWRQR